tara:strand:+ start:150 stop:872 length:723 start_codon:yes stop_codon:yes gene_type:complete
MEKQSQDNTSKGPLYIKALLDRSGSMQLGGLAGALVEGINSLISEQKNTAKLLDTDPYVDIYSFDISIDHLRSDSINYIDNIDFEEVSPRGATALSDSIGKVLEDSKEQENVLFFIFTDGEENASKKFKGAEGLKKIREMIKNYCENKNWTILFGAANIDAYKTSMDYGISPNNAFNVTPNAPTISKMMREVSNQLTCSSSTGDEINIDLIREASYDIEDDLLHLPPRVPSQILRAFNEE